VHAKDFHLKAFLSAFYSPDKEFLWIEGNGHVLISDAQQQSVLCASFDFFTRFTR